MSHPYGVIPSGQGLLYDLGYTKSNIYRKNGLGIFSLIDDAIIFEILSFCDPSALCSLSLTSHTFLVYAYNDSLWRDLLLIRNNGCGITFVQTWKETYAQAKAKKEASSFNIKPHHKNKGFVSDYLFKQWLCSCYSFTKDLPALFRYNNIPRRPATSLTVEDFTNTYEIPNTPVIITNGLEEWPALKLWDKEYLCRQFGEMKLRATSAAAAIPALFKIDEYFQYAEQVKEESPLYLFERNFAKAGSISNDFKVPCYFNHDKTDLFRLLNHRRPDYRWLVIGPARSGSIFHIDPNETNAWNACIKGRKKWIFYPPDVTPPGVVRSDDGSEVVVPISTSEWLLTFWAFHLEARCHPDPSKRPLEATLEEGEIIFVPHGYWHMVINLEFSIALTQNYVSTSNLSSVLNFLREKSDQISGVRDRCNDAVQPDRLYSEFLEVLRPSLGNDLLQQYINLSYHPKKGNSLLKKRKIQKLRKNQENDKKECVENEREENFSFSFNIA